MAKACARVLLAARPWRSFICGGEDDATSPRTTASPSALQGRQGQFHVTSAGGSTKRHAREGPGISSVELPKLENTVHLGSAVRDFKGG